MDAHGLYQGFRCDFNAKVYHPIAVVGQDDLHQVFPDIMHIALDGGQDDCTFESTVR